MSAATTSTLLTITLAVIRAAAFAHACSARIAIAFQPAPVPPAIAILLSRRSTGVALCGGRLPALLRCFATFGTVAIAIALIAAQILPRFVARRGVFSNVALVATKIGAITSQVLAFGGRARLVALPQILSELALVLSYVRAIGGDIALVPANVSRVLPGIATVLTNISAILAHPDRVGSDGLVESLLADVDGIEAFYARYSRSERHALKRLADVHNKFYTCGSDYHGYFNGAYVNPNFDAPKALLERLGLQ